MEKYENVCKLGGGACGSVYLVRNLENKKLCALKKIQLDETRKTRTKEAVLKEANILSKLKHPHIVTYQDSFFDKHVEFLLIIQDYCDGGTLEDKIVETRNKQEHFPEKQIMQWFIQIAMATQHMHSKKILHRDLKAQNVFLTKKGVIKLGDFGISKMLDSTIDQTSTVVGTPCYLSPELCQDIPYSSKSDVWALGCLLYEMCGLKTAFDAQNLISLFMKIVKGEYQPIPDHYSQSLKDLVAYILNTSPDDRPSASTILNHPFIKDHLSSFIEEKEYLLQQKIIKDTHNVKHANDISQSPSSNTSVLQTSLQSPGTNKIPIIEPPCIVEKLKPLEDPKPNASDSGVGIDITSKDDVMDRLDVHVSHDAGSDYSDDFDNSSDAGSDIAEVLPAVLNEAESDQRDCPEDLCDQAVEYADDFEEDNSSEDLDNIVSLAREVQDLTAEDDYIVDEDTDSSSLRQQWYDVLGEEKYEQMKKMICSNISEDDLGPSVIHQLGEGDAEVCYLSTEGLPWEPKNK